MVTKKDEIIIDALADLWARDVIEIDKQIKIAKKKKDLKGVKSLRKLRATLMNGGVDLNETNN
jgi:hypothetical protein